MSKIIMAILLLALGWHLSIIGISRFILSRRKNPTLKKLLRLIELDLLQTLRRKMKNRPSSRLKNSPNRTKLKEIENWLKRIREYEK